MTITQCLPSRRPSACPDSREYFEMRARKRLVDLRDLEREGLLPAGLVATGQAQLAQR